MPVPPKVASSSGPKKSKIGTARASAAASESERIETIVSRSFCIGLSSLPGCRRAPSAVSARGLRSDQGREPGGSKSPQADLPRLRPPYHCQAGRGKKKRRRREGDGEESVTRPRRRARIGAL